MRIRELERQINELNTNSTLTHEPVTPSNLASSQSRSISEEGGEDTPSGGAETPSAAEASRND